MLIISLSFRFNYFEFSYHFHHLILTVKFNYNDSNLDIYLIQTLIDILFLQDMFVVGTETISITLEWAMTELLRNSNKLKKTQEELEKIIGKGKSIEESNITRLPYLQAIVKETFRLLE